MLPPPLVEYSNLKFPNTIIICNTSPRENHMLFKHDFIHFRKNSHGKPGKSQLKISMNPVKIRSYSIVLRENM